MSRQYTLNVNLLVCSFSGCGMRFANKHEKTGRHVCAWANAKEANKVANQLQSTGIFSGGDGAVSSVVDWADEALQGLEMVPPFHST
ncbi:unnamed protein product [Prunus armeniaca]